MKSFQTQLCTRNILWTLLARIGACNLADFYSLILPFYSVVAVWTARPGYTSSYGPIANCNSTTFYTVWEVNGYLVANCCAVCTQSTIINKNLLIFFSILSSTCLDAVVQLSSVKNFDCGAERASVSRLDVVKMLCQFSNSPKFRLMSQSASYVSGDIENLMQYVNDWEAVEVKNSLLTSGYMTLHIVFILWLRFDTRDFLIS